MFYQFNRLRNHFSVKVDREKQIIVIDEYLEEISVEELQVSPISAGHGSAHSRSRFRNNCRATSPASSSIRTKWFTTTAYHIQCASSSTRRVIRW